MDWSLARQWVHGFGSSGHLGGISYTWRGTTGLSQQRRKLGGVAGPGRGLGHGPHAWCPWSGMLPSSSVTSCFLHVKKTGWGHHSFQRGKQAQGRQGSPETTQPVGSRAGARARPHPPSAFVPLHPLPWPGMWPHQALVELRCPLLALPSEPAAWFSPNKLFTVLRAGQLWLH